MKNREQIHTDEGDENGSAPPASREEKLTRIKRLVVDAVDQGRYQQILEEIERIVDSDDCPF